MCTFRPVHSAAWMTVSSVRGGGRSLGLLVETGLIAVRLAALLLPPLVVLSALCWRNREQHAVALESLLPPTGLSRLDQLVMLWIYNSLGGSIDLSRLNQFAYTL